MRLENIISDALNKTGNDKYKLTVAVSRRAVALSEGEKPLLKVKPNEKPTDIALKEMAAGLISIDQFINEDNN